MILDIRRTALAAMPPDRLRPGIQAYLYTINQLGEPQNLVLLQRANCGKFDILSGKSEEGETPRETALREIFEETGLIPLKLIDTGIEVAWFVKTKSRFL